MIKHIITQWSSDGIFFFGLGFIFCFLMSCLTICNLFAPRPTPEQLFVECKKTAAFIHNMSAEQAVSICSTKVKND
jgi:hypothetical protein